MEHDDPAPAPAAEPIAPLTGQRTTAAVWCRLAGLGALIAIGLALWIVVPGLDRHGLSAAIDDAGAWAPVGFAAGYVVATLLLLPKNVLSIAAGAAFGLAAGALLVWASAIAGAGVAFWVGRLLGRDGVERLAGRHLHRLDALVQRHGIASILIARLIPVIPFTAVNYGSGLTAVRFPAYLLATAIGIIPGTLTYVALGAYGTRPVSWQFFLAAGILVALSVTGVVLARARRRGRDRGRGRGRADADHNTDEAADALHEPEE